MSLALTDEYMHIHSVRDFLQARLDSKLNAHFLLNKHSDLYFLLHNNSAHVIILFNLKKLKKLSEGKKDIAESMHKTVTRGCKL